MPPPFAEVSDHLVAAINARAFPAAAIEIGGQKGVLWRRALGFLTYEPSAGLATADTIFDLASLTKVLATTSLAMRAIDDGRLRLEDPVARWIPEWKGDDRRDVTIADLLSHSSGLTAYLPFFRDCTRPRSTISRRSVECRSSTRRVRDRSTATWDSCSWDSFWRTRDSGATASRERRVQRDPGRRLDAQFRRLANFPHARATRIQPAEKLARSHGADGGGSVARPAPGRRGARREHVGPRRRRGSRWRVRNGCRRGSVRARGARHARRSANPGQDRYHAAVHPAVRSSRKLACAWMGHHAADVVVRHAPVSDSDRSHRIHRHVALDRLGARPLHCPADEPRAPDARERCDSTPPSAAARRGGRSLRSELSIDRGYGRRAECGRTERAFVQLKVTANRSKVRVGAGAARPTRETWGWRRRRAGEARSAAAIPAAARHVGARGGVATSATGSRKLRAALPSWHGRAHAPAGTIDGGHTRSSTGRSGSAPCRCGSMFPGSCCARP